MLGDLAVFEFRRLPSSELWFGVVVVAAVLVWLLRNYTCHGFHRFPGARLAGLTDWWRFYVVWRRKAHVTYLDLHERLGDVIRLGPNTLSFSSPEAMKTIYSLSRKLNKSDFYPVQMQVSRGRVLQSLFGTQDEEYHGRLRRFVSHAFSMSSIVRYEDRVNEAARVFMARTTELYAQTGRRCNMMQWMQFFAFDVITEITYSRRVGFIDQEEDVDGIIAWLDGIFQYMAPVGQMPLLDKLLVKNPLLILLSKYGWIDNSSGTARFSRARMRERLDEIARRRDEGIDEIRQRGDLLTMFLQAQKDDKTDFFNDERVLTMTTSIALAGSDTTAISLCSVLYHLLHAPRCYDRLMRELDQAQRDGTVSLDRPGGSTEEAAILSWGDVQKLPYLDACIRETLRYHPAISLNLERVTPPEGLVIDGHFIPGGTVVSCNPWVLHRRTDVFGNDASIFRPERWLLDPSADADGERARIARMQATMLHFGGGSRTCLGKHIALLELYKLIPSFLLRFEMKLVDHGEWDLENLWFVKPKTFELDLAVQSTS